MLEYISEGLPTYISEGLPRKDIVEEFDGDEQLVSIWID